MASYSDSYKKAGVDIEAGYEAVDRIKRLVNKTRIPGVLGTLGSFSGLFAPDLTGIAEPVLVSGTDGVGTKLKLAFLMDKHDTVGIDCVAMCVNDILCAGAKPLFFLDYIACGKMVPERVEQIVSGIAEGCVQSECALVGGETAEMPGFYPVDEYDLAGFSVGLADKAKLPDASQLRDGDVLIGLASSGVHSNGFSLVRSVFNMDVETLNRHHDELGGTLGETLLTPTRIYVKAIKALRAAVTVPALAHITGGGFYENVPRMLPEGLAARIDTKAWPVPPIFSLIQETGDISDHDMYNTFNMGIGMMAAVAKDDCDLALKALHDAGQDAWVIGQLEKGSGVTLC